MIDTGARKLELCKTASWPIPRNCDRTRTTDSTVDDLCTNQNCITILLRISNTKTIFIIFITRILHFHRNSTILKFLITMRFVARPTSFKIHFITTSTTEYQWKPTLVYVDPANDWNLINIMFEFINSSNTKLIESSCFSI